MSTIFEMRKLCACFSTKCLFVLLIVGLTVMPSSCTLASSYQQNAAALGPEPDLYLRFRKNTPTNNRHQRSDEYVHPFIRFRKSAEYQREDPYRFLYPSYVPSNQ